MIRYRYGRSIWEIGLWVIDMGYGIWYMDMINYHIDMINSHIDIVILDINMGCGLMIWEMTASIRSSPISIWDILSLCSGRV